MTNKEYREAHRLTEREKAQTWQEIRNPRTRRTGPARHWRPAIGGLAAAACVLAVAMILTDQAGRGPASAPKDVAVRSSERPAAAPPAARSSRPEATRDVPTTEIELMKEGVGDDPDEIYLSESVQAVQAVPSGGVLRGTVCDRESGEPLAHATVVLVGSSRSTSTDARGGFEIAGLPPGRHMLQVRYLGYDDFEQRIAVVEADTLETVVALATEVVDRNPTVVAMEAVPDFAESFVPMPSLMVGPGESKSSASGGRLAREHTWNDGAESGGTHNPNDRPYDLVYHENYGVNPFVASEDDSLSTFALEVDDASWTMARRYLTDGNLPPAEAIRLEEIVNRLDPGYPVNTGEDFTLHTDGMPSRFGKGYHLLRVGVQARDIPALERRPAHLVFVIDISGSMDRENRLGLVKKALRVLVNELQAGDRVGIVVYGSQARTILEPTGIDQRETIITAIDGLRSGGSTNAEAGLRLAYAMAREHATEGAISRLVLCSDGVANVGNTGPGSILESVRKEADQGTSLTAIGFGMGNYNDVLMEQLADQGDGTYHYVQQIADAERVFRQNLTGTLQTVGAETKSQVAFDPASVARWRLLGYENRDVADEDFRNDTIDAGEIGAGHTAVALYEIKLTPVALADLEAGRSHRLGTLRLRWAKPRHHEEAGTVTEIERPLTTTDIAPGEQQAAPHLRLAAVAAEFAEILRHSYWARGSQFQSLVTPTGDLLPLVNNDLDALELYQMITRAADLQAND